MNGILNVYYFFYQQGIVLDGYAGLDAAYSPRPKTFELHWDSFFDPDSGIVSDRFCSLFVYMCLIINGSGLNLLSNATT